MQNEQFSHTFFMLLSALTVSPELIGRFDMLAPSAMNLLASLPAVQVANTFVIRFGADGAIDHLKLQKLSYYAYGWWLALRPDAPALINVRPQVWKLGPVFLPIYSAFVGARFGNITQPQKIGPFRGTDAVTQSNSDHSQLIDWIWERYGKFSGVVLSDMTHEEGTPWYTVAQQHNFVVPKFLDMPDAENRAYFTEMGRQEGIIV